MQYLINQPRSFLGKNLKEQISWHTLKDYAFIILGAFVQAIGMRLFLIPSLLVSGGISGAAQIIQFYTNWNVGLMVFLGNIPLFIIGWRYLGGIRFALRTAMAVVFFSIFTDWLVYFLPSDGITADVVLQSIYGGVIYGVGLGLVYRGQGTSGGSDILCRIINHYLGIPLTQTYLIVDAFVVLAGGFSFGWDLALYGMVVIYVSGLAAELIAEGNSMFRTAMIITQKPEIVSHKILSDMERGVTILNATGAYTDQPRPVLYCVISRSEVNKLKSLVSEIDPKAFMVIGQANEALGEGFQPLKR